MKIRFLICLLLCLVLFPAASAAKDDWIEVRSKNFHLIGNASEKNIRNVATKLEQFREVFRLLMPRTNFNSVIPTTVLVFKSDKSFEPYKGVKWAAGYFQAGEDINYIALSTERESSQTYRTIYHEYIHFLINNNFGRSNVPPWFNEGIAEYYEMFAMKDDQEALLGLLQDEKLYLLQQQSLIPFETYFNINYSSLHSQGGHGASIFYAQSWALLHYLQQANSGARRQQLSTFLNLVLKNKPPREAFKEAFQTDYATMEKELRDYVGQRRFTAQKFTLKEKLLFDNQMQTKPISEAQANAYLGDLLLHTNEYDKATKKLQEALALDADNAMAHASLGMTRMRQKNFPEAKKHLEKAVALNANNHLAHYYYAFTLSREGMDENNFVSGYSAETTEKMRQSLRRTMELNPDFPESYRLLAFTNLVNNQNLDEGVLAVKKALSLQPGNQWYEYVLAQLYMRKEDFAGARAITQKLVAGAEEDNLRNAAQSLLNNLNSYEQHLARVKEMKAEAEKSGGRTIVIENTENMSEEEILNQAINDALRKLQAGEQRVAGYLTQIDCDSKGQTFVVRGENQTYRFRVASGAPLSMTAFTPEANGQEIGCGTSNITGLLIATFRPATDAKAKLNGELVALEFVPKNFKLKQ